ncbi:hypothetical protein EDC14_101364 [Hydrogenispora ethanolica]|uniref:Uncharacterized protein n=1 Tax=Hydrogenispora ethanolica TaxID=1082276 RepID=A0A4R1RQE5_HYDET|nr:hypothetical protein EDC14_101364 [Hydrogenispora ethanolica]
MDLFNRLIPTTIRKAETENLRFETGYYWK